MFTEIVALISVLIAGLATFIALNQNALNRRAMQAQTFVAIVNTAREIKFSQGMDKIRLLNYKSYAEFKKSEPVEVQEHIREVVDFLNDIRHLIKHGYLTKEHVLNIYFISIMACSDRLLP